MGAFLVRWLHVWFFSAVNPPVSHIMPRDTTNFQSAPVPVFGRENEKHLLIKSVHKNIEKPGGGADQSRRGSATLDATRRLNFSKRVHFQKIYNPDTNETKLL